MLHYAVVFFIIAIIAAAMGFGGIAGMSADIGWLFATLAVVIIVIGLLGQVLRGGPPAAIP